MSSNHNSFQHSGEKVCALLDGDTCCVLVEHMLNGFAYCKMLYCEDGTPRDFLYLYTNPAFEELTGLKQVTGKLVSEVIPDIRNKNSQIFEIYSRVANGGQPERFEIFIDALEAWFSIYAYSPKLGYFVAIFAVITDQKRAEQELRIAATAFESHESMMILDTNEVIQRVNKAFTKLTGYSAEEVIGQTPRLLKSGHHKCDFYSAMRESLRQTGEWQGEIWDKHKNGEIYPAWTTITAVKNKDQTTTHYVVVQSDISARKAAEAEIASLAYKDPLTGLPNRRMFQDRLQQEIKKYERTRSPLALLVIDLDHFKEVNDTLGHDQGDILIQEAAKRLLGCIRDYDTLARVGGDEFVIILSDLKEARDAEHVAKSIVDAVHPPFSLGQELGFVSASIGIAIYPNDTTDQKQLLKHADQAMYSAKNQGRNRYCYFTQAMQEAAENHLRLANELRLALSNGTLELHYQPIVNIVTGTFSMAEALIRWNHPVLGLVSPAQFIPIAEHAGLINEIGNWVFQEAVRRLKKWRDNIHPGFKICINKSPVHFHAFNKSHEGWIDYLHSLDLPGECLVFEITEGFLMKTMEEAHQKLLDFKDQGIRVAIDDFGTGYSALSYLNKFDIDYLKIDQSFVRNISLKSSDISLCKAIIVMAHELGVKVIAEGVETFEQHNILTQAGCDYAQGYFYAKPMNARDFQRMMLAQHPLIH